MDESLLARHEFDQQVNQCEGLTMMTGPDVYVRCPRCAHVGMYFTFLSGNTFGAKYYTDGRRVAPSLPGVPAVVACLGCEAAFWRDQAEEVAGPRSRMRFPGINDGEERDPAIESAKPLKEPDEAGYFKWFDTLLAENPERERELRRLVWWRGNDRHRMPRAGLMPDFAEIDRMYNLRGAPQPVDDEPADLVMAREANMRRLLALLPTDDSASNPMQAELLRQLGEFDRALAVLSLPLPAELDTARKKLQALCEARDRKLGVLN